MKKYKLVEQSCCISNEGVNRVAMFNLAVTRELHLRRKNTISYKTYIMNHSLLLINKKNPKNNKKIYKNK